MVPFSQAGKQLEERAMLLLDTTKHRFVKNTTFGWGIVVFDITSED